MKISKGRFVKVINALKEADKLQGDINKLMRSARDNIENDFMNAAGLMICHADRVIELLSAMFDDEFDTISWWIYETQYGKSGTEIFDREGNVLHNLKTAEDLYDYITNC